MIDGPVLALLHAVRRRLRLAWMAATVQWLAPAVALGALVIVLLGRFQPWTWPERVALGGPAAIVVVLAAGAAALRIPLPAVALVADRGLGTHDTFSTVLEVGEGSFANRIRARADALATNRRSRDAVAIRLEKRRVMVTIVIGVLALALALFHNPQDTVRARRAAERAAVQASAAELKAEAERLAARATNEAERAVADELAKTAAELARTSELALAEELLRRTEATFAAQVPTDLLSAKAASKGLNRSLVIEPLAGGSATSAHAQLAAAAARLPSATTEDQAELADRLNDLAESQRVGDPTTAQALAAAAASIKAGNLAAASGRLSQAAASAKAASDRLAKADAARAGAAVAGAAAGRAAGQGQGSGQGAGQGQAGEGGSPSGNVGGQGSGGGQQSGAGGAGTPGGQSGSGPGSNETPQLGDVRLPQAIDGEQLNAGGTTTGDPGEVVGTGNGPTQGGIVSVAVSDLLPTYRAQALDALDHAIVSPSDRTLVTNYFDQLAGPK